MPSSPDSRDAPTDPASAIAPLRRLVHDLANAVQAQDLEGFHERARAVVAESRRLGADDVAAAAVALLALHPADDDGWDDTVVPVRTLQQAMRQFRSRVEGGATP